MFKAIFWDNDGVLVNTEPVYFEATRKILAQVGVVLTESFFMKEHLRTNKSAFSLAKEKGFSDEAIQELRKKRDILYLGLLAKNVKVIDGVIETLEKLRGKFVMGIVTSSKKTYMDAIFNASGLERYFNFVITTEDVAHEKPHPEPYLLALKKTGFQATDCVVIEDSERGVIAAKEAEIQCFAIPNKFSRFNDFSRADRVLTGIRDLPFHLLNETKADAN